MMCGKGAWGGVVVVGEVGLMGKDTFGVAEEAEEAMGGGAKRTSMSKSSVITLAIFQIILKQR